MKFRTILLVAFLSISLLSCKDTNKETRKETSEPITPAETRSTMEYNENRLDSIPKNTTSGHDFKGGGDEPFWSIEISDKKIHFQSPDINYKSITAVINTIDTSGNTITFNSENEGETIKVALLEQECKDRMSGKKNSHKVEVLIKRKSEKDPRTYDGCGSFVNK
ncbi:hypothetical protein [Aequorivita capsosiphonis]|uniref:hypothetical protein n=1 Tax=Aequorivita capsosiphonis TaxID=487317 RepID=UPI0003FB7ACA|nr:hypothetical protein [Aequorivita capsosiphonis]